MYFGGCHTPSTCNTIRDRQYQGVVDYLSRGNISRPYPHIPFFLWRSKHSSISVSCVFLTLTLLLHYTLSRQGYNWNIVKSFAKKNLCTAKKKDRRRGGGVITVVSFIGGRKQSTRRNHPSVTSNLVRLNRGRDRVVDGFPSPIILTATI